MPGALEVLVRRNSTHLAGNSLLALNWPAGTLPPPGKEGARPSLQFFNRDLRNHRWFAGNPPPDSVTLLAPWYRAERPHDAAVMHISRDREVLEMDLAMAVAALRKGGKLMIAGPLRNGIASARARLARACGRVLASDSARHWKAYIAERSGDARDAAGLDGWARNRRADALRW